MFVLDLNLNNIIKNPLASEAPPRSCRKAGSHTAAKKKTGNVSYLSFFIYFKDSKNPFYGFIIQLNP